MSDILVSEFRVGHKAGGSAALASWISANIAAGANQVLAIKPFTRGGDLYTLAAMATNTTTNHAGASTAVYVGEFELQDAGTTALASWMNSTLTGTAAPTTPSLSLVAAGTLTTQGTGYVKLTYVTAQGESGASVEASLAITDNHELVVASPAAATGVTGYNVYIASTTGAEKKQNTTAIAIGTNYTLTAAIGTSGVVAPTTNGSAAKYLQSLSIEQSLDGAVVRVQAVLTN